ncbi:TonB-dependent receptor plug domain-containing protein [Paludibaculum fermentans]|uniref:TonB-dependent receptor plug domain-containing protein n=1 Tax=Paludibaculum fermentans TaxID=1473598 RepID=UPI003EBA37BE
MSRSTTLLAAGLFCAFAMGAEPPGKPPPDLNSMPIEQLMDLQVQTATLRKQSLKDAPANVTIVTADEIRKFGYRTLSEALSNVRGFYPSSDGPFRFMGTRGFSLLGDFNMRFLVLINGHSMTDNVYGAMYYFGEDFPLSLDLVDQIEIVRGPSSALYGSNGVFATINIITKTPKTADGLSASLDAGTFGDERVSVTSATSLGRNAGLLISATASRVAGRRIELQRPGEAGLTPTGVDRGGNGEGYNLFANLAWGEWSVTAVFGQHLAEATTGWYKTEIGNTGTTDLESRNFVEAAWHRDLGEDSSVRWRIHYDQYRYDAIYDYGEGIRNYDGALGDWGGSEFVYQRGIQKLGTLTLGAEGSVDLRNTQYNFDVTTSGDGITRQDNFRISHRRARAGLFAQQEVRLFPRWTLYLGGRVDDSNEDKAFVSPRVALVYERKNRTYKVMYGRAFRNPSTFERYWEPNPELRAERANTFEVTREQRLGKKANFVASVFHYGLSGLIEGVQVRPDTLQYRNSSRAKATGFELEINGQPTEWLEAAASVSIQRTRGADATSYLQNSPAQLGLMRAAVPLLRRRLMAGGAVRYMGTRLAADGSRLPGATVADLTLTTTRLFRQMNVQFGIRNLMNKAYQDPLSPEHATLSLPAAGRSVFVRFLWRND